MNSAVTQVHEQKNHFFVQIKAYFKKKSGQYNYWHKWQPLLAVEKL
jgi:hypothetical protein